MNLNDISKKTDQLIQITHSDLMPLPYPYNTPETDPVIRQLTEDQRNRYEASLDGTLAIGIPKPETKKQEEELVRQFLSGLARLLTKENNWTFLQPLYHSLEYCVKCQICSDSCPAYIASGKQEIYRPTYRPEILRRIINKYIKKKSGLSLKLSDSNIELNWILIARLAELSYRCTLCRRCAQVCPLGVDNGLISREIRKLFSQEMGIAPKELHESGTIQQLKIGSSAGITPKALNNIVGFIEDEIEEKIGKRIAVPFDKKGAEILLLHNAGEFISWPENVMAFAIIFESAGISWTMSSELIGYDAVNYGVWYDDIQLTRIAVRHAEIARELGVKKINVGECGHAHKAMMAVADRVLTGDLDIPRESVLPLLADLVIKDKIQLDTGRNNFPVTLHDPCNMVRLMGIVEPQRQILRKICPRFIEMEPHGVDNYCCGGGSGLAVIQSMNFPDWRNAISGRMKLKQILETFQDLISPDIPKYICTPCSNCKGQIRDLFNYYNVNEKCGIFYGGIAELIANAMTDIKKPFIEWEWH